MQNFAPVKGIITVMLRKWLTTVIMVLSFVQVSKHGISWNFANQLIDYKIVIKNNSWTPLKGGVLFFYYISKYYIL